MDKEQTIILEQVSTNGTWTTNLPLNEYHKTYIEYMKLCDVVPTKRLENKFIIIPSYKRENLLICLYFNSTNNNEDTSDKFISTLIDYTNDPKEFHECLIDLKVKQDKERRQRILDATDEDFEEDAIADEDSGSPKKRSSVYELTGYEIPNRSPRKSSIASINENPRYITRGSFSNVASVHDMTEVDCDLRLVYLMNEEYFSNFHELEQLSKFKFQIFNKVNEKLSSNVDWKTQVKNALKKHNKNVDII